MLRIALGDVADPATGGIRSAPASGTANGDVVGRS